MSKYFVDGWNIVAFNYDIMQIEVTFQTDEIDADRLAALSREALRQRKSLDEYLKERFNELADDLLEKKPKKQPA